jgi:hypothetical protein
MAANDRTDAQIREEISQERRELGHALTDLREDVGAAARTAALVGGALAALGAAAAAIRHFTK